MVQLDPRMWHQSAIIRLYEANKSTAIFPLLYGNFRAAWTGSAALVTQVAILLVKNTCGGALGGILRFVRVETNAPGWREWKASASKVADYAKSVWISSWTVPWTLFTYQASRDNVLFQFQKHLVAIPEVTQGLDQFRQKRQNFSIEALGERITHAVKKVSEALPATKNENLPYQNFNTLHDALTPLAAECAGIVRQCQGIVALYSQWYPYFSPREIEELKTFAPATQELLKTAQGAESSLKAAQAKILKRQKDAVNRGSMLHGQARDEWQEKWNRYPFPQENDSLIKVKEHQKQELNALHDKFLEFAQFLDEGFRDATTAWFRINIETLVRELTPLHTAAANARAQQLQQLKDQVQEIQGHALAHYTPVIQALKLLHSHYNEDLYTGLHYKALDDLRAIVVDLPAKLKTSTAALEGLKQRVESQKDHNTQEVIQLIESPITHPLKEPLEQLRLKFQENPVYDLLWQDAEFQKILESLYTIVNTPTSSTI